MNEIIKIEEREGIQTVNARELWERLESKRQFADWIKDKLDGFVENVDFTVHKFVNGKATQIDYCITLDTAKHLAMLERNDRGREMREYFIKVEKAWNTPEMILARALQVANKTIEDFKYRAFEAERKNAVLMHVRKTYTAGEIAKELGMRSAQELNKAMQDAGIQYKQNGTWIPRADYSEQGFFEIKQQELDTGKVIYDRRITQTGRDMLLSMFGCQE